MLAQLDTFVGPEVGWFALSPMLTLLGGALALMLLGALTPKWPNGWYATFSAVMAGTAGAFAMVQWDDITENGPTTLVGGVIAFDTLAMFLTITICIALLLVSLLTLILPNADRISPAHPARAIDISSPLAQSDPDASGHPRPRAPGFAASAA